MKLKWIYFSCLNMALLAINMLQAQNICTNNHTSIYFEVDIHTINDARKATLDGLIKKNPSSVYIEVSGHCDSTGTPQHNKALSERRAKSIADYITKKSTINKKDIKIAYYGDKQPVASNVTEDGRAKNRRGEIILLPINDDRLVFESNGLSVEVPQHLVEAKKICDCNFNLTTFSNAKEAENNGVDLKINEKELLSISGMIALGNSECLKLNNTKKGCTFVVNIPVQNNTEGLGIWSNKEGVWNKTNYPAKYNTDQKAFVVEIPCTEWSEDFIACGTAVLADIFVDLSFPNLKSYRDPLLDSAQISGKKQNDSTYVINLKDIQLNAVFSDVAQLDSVSIFYINKEIKSFQKPDGNIEIPLSAYTPLAYRDTVLQVSVKKDATFITKVTDLDIEINNAIFKQERKFFFDKLSGRERYWVKVPIMGHQFILNGNEIDEEILKIKYDTKKEVNKTKVKK